MVVVAIAAVNSDLKISIISEKTLMKTGVIGFQYCQY